LKNVANINTVTHGIVLRETRETLRGQWTDLKQDTSDGSDRDSRDGTGGRECRVAVINPKKFPASLITISVEELLLECVFMLDTGAESNLIKARSVHPSVRKSLGKIKCILSV